MLAPVSVFDVRSIALLFGIGPENSIATLQPPPACIGIVHFGGLELTFDYTHTSRDTLSLCMAWVLGKKTFRETKDIAGFSRNR